MAHHDGAYSLTYSRHLPLGPRRLPGSTYIFSHPRHFHDSLTHPCAQMATASNTHPFVPPTFLNVTALWAENGASVLQCWQILPGFTTSSQSGTAGASILQLGGVSNMSYSVLPPGFNAGIHNAP